MTTGLKCPTCDAPLPAGADYCEACGQDLCPVCHAPLDEAATRCEACGAEFEMVCPRCEEPIAPDFDECPHCGLSFAETGGVEFDPDEDERMRTCPTCGDVIYLEDGFCRSCGQELCPRCGGAIDEVDDVCPHCDLPLYFQCPSCDFELMVGTEVCPGCQTLFPRFCIRCGAAVKAMAQDACAACGEPIALQVRESVEVVHTIAAGGQRTRIIACPACGANFNPATGDCPRCAARVCPVCQLGLLEHEKFCPRCGLTPAKAREELQETRRCPRCARPMPAGATECPHCQQQLCPQCLAPVEDDAIACAHCGAEFELACPQCDAAISADDASCPHCGLVFQ